MDEDDKNLAHFVEWVSICGAPTKMRLFCQDGEYFICGPNKEDVIAYGADKQQAVAWAELHFSEEW